MGILGGGNNNNTDRDGFQPMEMDLTAFDDEEDGVIVDQATDSYLRRRGMSSGGSKSSKSRGKLIFAVVVILVLIVGGVVISTSSQEDNVDEMSENNHKSSEGEDLPNDTDGAVSETENPTMAPTIVASKDDDVAVPTNPPTAVSSSNGDDQEDGDGEDTDTDNATPPPPPSSTTNSSSSSSSTIEAPVAKRDEDQVVYFGVAPTGWDMDVPRQEVGSKFPLLDPPIAVPDPYGWLRREYTNDDTTIRDDILEYLHAENNYTTSMTSDSSNPTYKSLQHNILDELVLAMEETFHTVPLQQPSFSQQQQDDDDYNYYYYTRTMKDVPYKLHCRAPTDFGHETEDTNDIGRLDELKQVQMLAHHLNVWDGSIESPVLPGEEVWLNENDLVVDSSASSSSSSSHLDVGDIAISPDGIWVAYTIDDTGDEIYHLVIEEIATNRVIFWGGHGAGFDTISSTVVFGNERTTLFIMESDDAQRDSMVQKCEIELLQEGMLGSDRLVCEVIFEEKDIEYWVSIRKTLDQRYLLVESASSTTTEIWYLDLIKNKEDDSDGDGDEDEDAVVLTPVAHRIPNVLYSVDHGNGVWWMVSNIKKPEFDLLYSPVGSHDWTSIQGKDDDDGDDNEEDTSNPASILKGHSLDGVTVLENHVVIEGRLEKSGLPQIWIAKINDETHAGLVSVVPVLEDSGSDSDAAHTIEYYASATGSFATSSIIIVYESLVTPTQYVVVNLDEDEFEIPVHVEGHGGEDAVAQMLKETLLMQRPVDGYDADLFECQRILVPGHGIHDDETVLIPVSLVYLKSTMEKAQTEPVPLHLYAYGAYGVSIEDRFASSRLPLLERGVIYAIAHVRGGGELGQWWYESGKLLNKMNTFEDFIEVAKYFIELKQWTTPDLLSIEGRSAGGLTMGAVVNMAPELFRVALLGVPFVDVLATMSDATIPLTALKWLEWGNPNEEEYFDYMKGYSPMNNVQEDVTYPSMLILAGLYDPRVAYWEPAKLTATLRYSVANIPEERPILLKTDMTSGHFSASDRYKYLEAKAFEYAFILDQLGIQGQK